MFQELLPGAREDLHEQAKTQRRTPCLSSLTRHKSSRDPLQGYLASYDTRLQQDLILIPHVLQGPPVHALEIKVTLQRLLQFRHVRVRHSIDAPRELHDKPRPLLAPTRRMHRDEQRPEQQRIIAGTPQPRAHRPRERGRQLAGKAARVRRRGAVGGRGRRERKGEQGEPDDLLHRREGRAGRHAHQRVLRRPHLQAEVLEVVVR